MRVVQISQVYRPVVGGQEVYIQSLQQILAAAGIASRVMQPWRGEVADDIINVPRIPGLSRFVPGLDPYVMGKVVRIGLQRYLRGADLIIAHYALSAQGGEAWADKMLIVSHGVEWHTEDQNWDDRAREANARRWFDRCTHVVNDTHYLRHLGLDVAPGTGCFTEVAPGKWFIPNCVDATRFHRTNGIAEWRNKRVVLVPRQITRDRGIDLAVRAFAIFEREHPGHTLLLLGTVRERAYLEECMAIARELGVYDAIVVKSDVRNEAMADYYSSALVTLIPTLRREGTSLSALESMSCGTPTVSTNVAGLRDLPTRQADPNPEAVARALIEVVRDGGAIAEEQRHQTHTVFNFANWSRAWLSAIDAVAGNSRLAA
jgi:glycosyltransferase involved in cell wall biosynthesis